MFDLISIGDSVVDTFIPLEDARLEQKQGERKLILRYGDKIPVGPSTSLVAGNAANNAVGSSRLGLKTAVFTYVGDKDEEEYDQRIVAKFKLEKVDTRYIMHDKNLPSNHHIVLNFKGDRTILIYHQPWSYQLPDLDKTRWVYFTSLGPTYVESNLVPDLINYLERTGTKLLFNPGTFQIKLGVKKNARLLSLTEVFIVNLEEAKLILGFDEGRKVEIKKLLKGIADLGPRMAVITDGAEGSYGFDGEKFFKLGIFKADLLEMTGSGDAYATAVCAALSYGKNLAEAMRWGAANGASVVEQIGPQAGLLTYDKMQEKLKANLKIQAQEI
ncbi:MAG: carbohydrate kinase family protein [Candidatus Daviesbacteria bacterium]|nr:MAG: carbohydrate kinase family protein [Candidatus Daviesbacteria bacterium]